MSGCATFQTGASETLPAGQAVSIAGRGQLRVIDENPQAAQTVLLVHGYGASSASYKPVIPALAKSMRVLAVDLPGFGKSDRRAGDYTPEALADVLVQILDQKGVQRAHVVGHSWGSSVALAFARRHGDRLDKLVVISGWVYDEQLLPMMRWARLPGLGEALYGAFYTPESVSESLYLNFSDPSLVTEEVIDEVKRSREKQGAVAAALAAARGMRFAAVEHSYATIRAPALVLWGREDRVARLPFGERLARELPHARLVVIPQCGHIPMWECRGETEHALVSFLAEAP